MKSLAVIAFLAVLSVALAQSAPRAEAVKTEGGVVDGTAEGTVRVYRGIPFAAPPVGDLRWRAPQPAKAWTGVLHADKYAPGCMQIPLVNRSLGLEAVPVSEDCLYLNVWTPAKTPQDHLAVMVWIYGGGFIAGATQTATYNGVNLANKGVVVVSVAYRVGPFGFLAHPELSAEAKGHSGNYGLLDQIAGLQWVQRNIAAFGGDPDRVTIFGESAGGISVSMLAASPLAGGLFQGAISESGGSFAPARLTNEAGENVPPLSIAERNGAAYLSRVGASSIAEGRKLAADAVLKGSGPGLAGTGAMWPNFDGYVLVGDQYKLYEAGRFNDVPVLIGINSDEGALFVRSTTASAYQTNVRTGYGDYADKILAAYPAGSEAEALRSARDLARDSTFGWHTWAWAQLQSRTGQGKVFVYYFKHRPPYPDLPELKDWGAAHGGEIAYVFGNFGSNMMPTAADRALSNAMSSYWTNFAKTGDPNGPNLAAWPAYSNAKAEAMYLDDPPKAWPMPNLEKLQVLEGYYAWRRSQAAQH